MNSPIGAGLPVDSKKVEKRSRLLKIAALNKEVNEPQAGNFNCYSENIIRFLNNEKLNRDNKEK